MRYSNRIIPELWPKWDCVTIDAYRPRRIAYVIRARFQDFEVCFKAFPDSVLGDGPGFYILMMDRAVREIGDHCRGKWPEFHVTRNDFFRNGAFGPVWEVVMTLPGGAKIAESKMLQYDELLKLYAMQYPWPTDPIKEVATETSGIIWWTVFDLYQWATPYWLRGWE